MEQQPGRSELHEYEGATSSRHGPTGHNRSYFGGRRVRAPEPFRRGHSDGDVLSRHPGGLNQQLLTNGETWMDFLRHSDTGRDERERAQLAIRRAAIMSADRRRRLTDQEADNTRRRSSSIVSFGQPSTGRRRSGMSYPASDNTSAAFLIPSRMDDIPRQQILDRPLPRRASQGMQQSSRSGDISLPGWQPDGEVTKCPICGTSFSFWYRKHHCRKCGRVVCANCSPHRITIPRQYIVHPPDQDPHPSSGTSPGIEVVDLTGGDGENTETTSQPLGPRNLPRNHETRLDPALGGGQEVRLCNPCVPDPNPLPHLYPSPAQPSLDPLSSSAASDGGLPSSIAPPRRNSIRQRLPPEPVRTASNSQIYGHSRDPLLEVSRGAFSSSSHHLRVNC